MSGISCGLGKLVWSRRQSDCWKPDNSLQKQIFLLAHFTNGIIKTEKDQVMRACITYMRVDSVCLHVAHLWPSLHTAISLVKVTGATGGPRALGTAWVRVYSILAMWSWENDFLSPCLTFPLLCAALSSVFQDSISFAVRTWLRSELLLRQTFAYLS